MLSEIHVRALDIPKFCLKAAMNSDTFCMYVTSISTRSNEHSSEMQIGADSLTKAQDILTRNQ